ncbi:MAG: ABC transporter substrate-binding protein [Dehalococcoidia bacterium]
MSKKLIGIIVAVVVVVVVVVLVMGRGGDGGNGNGGDGEPLPSEYIGSGALDGDGIPVDFFSDIDVRKAFCYAFDYDTYIADALNGQGVQKGSPVVEGLYGYYADTPMYSYNLTKAVEHMQAAWDGEAWEKGFKFTLLYNAGNLPRKTACELVSEAWAKIGADYAEDPERFQVSIQALAWPTILGKIFGTRDMPMFQIGWLPDYPHADNFIHPFMHSEGVFSHYQGYGDATTDAAIAAAFAEPDYATQMALYADLQEQYYNDAPGIVLAQPIVRRYFTQHIDGFYYNPVESSYAGRLTDMSKSDQGGDIPYKNDGVFVFETIGDIYSLDPAWVYDTASGMQVGLINEQLLYYDGSSTEDFQPLLATTWSFNDTHYRFTIREGVQFSNGNDLTPEDVEYTFERAMCQDRPGGPIWMFYAMMLGSDVGHYEDTTFAEIDAAVEVDGNDVVFKVSDPAWEIPFLQIMSGQWACIVDKEYCIANGDWGGTEGDVENFLHPENPGDIGHLYNNPMGTGPWKLNTWDQGVQIILEDNELYWGAPVPFDNVITKVVDEWSSRKLSLLAGDADLVYVPASRFVEMEPEEPDLQVFKDLPSLSIDAFFFNLIIGGPEE